MAWIVNPGKGDFVGKRSLVRSDIVREDRKQLVGLLTDDPAHVLMEGTQLIDDAEIPAPPAHMLGLGHLVVRERGARAGASRSRSSSVARARVGDDGPRGASDGHTMPCRSPTRSSTTRRGRGAMVDVRSPLAHRAARPGRRSTRSRSRSSRRSTFGAREADAARLGFPMTPNTVAGDMTRGVLWLGPDEWLVVAAPGDPGAVAAELEAALDGTHHAVVDVSANRAVIELRGLDRLELLASACSLDLDPRRRVGARRLRADLVRPSAGDPPGATGRHPLVRPTVVRRLRRRPTPRRRRKTQISTNGRPVRLDVGGHPHVLGTADPPCSPRRPAARRIARCAGPRRRRHGRSRSPSAGDWW